MSTVKNYLSLIKFSHTIFAMPFALVGFFIGLFHKKFGEIPFTGSPDVILEEGRLTDIFSRDMFILLLLVLACMVTARTAAMAFNRYLDRHYDAQNPRTLVREIPKGIIKPENALMFTIVNCVLFTAFTWFINPLCFFLSPVALLVILGYSYTKRFTPLCHLILGLGLSLAPIGAYLAVTAHFTLLPVFFSLAVICWVSGFDIIYALQDEEFDKSQQLYSIPASVGKKNALRVSRILHVFSALFVVIAGWYGGFGLWYWSGVVIFCGMLIYQQSIVKPHDLKRVNLAFMTANGVASVVFAIFVITDLFV
jgi:4-hydroxybenzoate polyprenyltransferase